MRVLAEESVPGVEARWLDVSEGLDAGTADGRERALVVTAPGLDRWVCCVLAPADGDVREAVALMDDEDGRMAVARCSAAFGMPWAKLSERQMRAQLFLLLSADDDLREQIAALSPEQLTALRAALSPGLPGDVARALRWCREYAEMTQ